jgi:alpha-L-arabinofuranosidase|eukprot:COSAG06_NODE_3707_length_4993_cov_331.834083_7_plen_57_part_00
MADLVDWLHGDASTEWGAKRIAAGHPQPYNLTHFEFGANLNATVSTSIDIAFAKTD